MAHDDRSDTDAQRIYLYSIDRIITSYCAAAWFNVHPAFNPGTIQRNNNTIARMLEPELASPPNTIRLRFEINDPDGIHTVKLLSPNKYERDLKLRDCKELNGGTDDTVEFVTNQLPYYTDVIVIRMLDGTGNYIEHEFEVKDTPLPFSPEEELHIPDPNLAAAIRDQIGGLITTHTIADLTELDANDKGIKDLTGLEHAQNLIKLSLSRNNISDISPLSKLTQLHWLYIGHNNISDISLLSELIHLRLLDVSGNDITEIPQLKDLIHLDFLDLNGNRISDVSPLRANKRLEKLFLYNNSISDISSLSEMPQLKVLLLPDNKVSDISPLSEHTQLIELYLRNNTISDISPLSKLTQLKRLELSNNQIIDVSPLVELVNLIELDLFGNQIKNNKPPLELLRKNPDIKIYLKNDREPLPVTLSHFRAEHSNTGVILKWTTESEVDNAGFYIYRSETRDGEFKVINPTMVQGAGTTGERNEYMWTDTTAKPNTVYYYRIEDIPHAGVRKQLATVRLRGLVSAKGKLTTRWVDLKMQE